ncbi:MAG: phenylacetate--CoA ligase family protein [Parvibaculaceae bacterium]
MSDHYDSRETADAGERERELFRRLPEVIEAALAAPGWQKHLGGIDPRTIASREALAALPVLRKSALPALQKAAPPFGGFSVVPTPQLGRLFTSPGPIYEGELAAGDEWRYARVLFAAGIRPGDVVLNCFSYHMTPGGFILDSGARALGCPVIPAGPGNSEHIVEIIAHLRPQAYCGTPDFLKILLDKAEELGRDVSALRKASVSGAAFPPSLQAEIAARGIDAYQAYATADLGGIAYETKAREGLVLNEDIILEILRPGTGDPVAPGEVGEIAVTLIDRHRPLIRFALGDMTALLPGSSACGRSNRRIKGWMGRADQTAKIRGMFVRPEQIAEIARRHPGIERLRLVIGRAGEQDTAILEAETGLASEPLEKALMETAASITHVRCDVALVPPGSLPNDGKVIADERPVA